MALITFKIRIKEDGKPEVDLPEDLPVGEYTATLQVEATLQEDKDWENQPWTEEELEELLKVEPLTGKEIVEMGLTGGWEDLGITDSVAWVEEQRRKRREQLGW